MLLSICIPTYNRAHNALDTVMKCLEIPGDFYEVLVIDDGSDDETQRVFESIKNKKFRYQRNSQNLGYANMGYSLKVAIGDYCLLLGDKDEIVYADWDWLAKHLEDNTESSIFHWEYYDYSGEIIRGVTDNNKHILKRCTFDAGLFTKYHFVESAGFIFRHNDVMAVWDRIDKDTSIWNLYPQSVLAVYLSTTGDCEYIDKIETRLKPQDRKIHVQQTFAGGKEPYWRPESRHIQNSEWITLISQLEIDDGVKRHLMHTICVNAIKQFGRYYKIITDEKKMSMTFYDVRREQIEGDRKRNERDWMQLILSEEKHLLKCIEDSYTWKKKNLIMETEYFIRRKAAEKEAFEVLTGK